MTKPWYETKLRRQLLDFHTPEWPSGVLSKFDARALVNEYKRARINVAAFDAKCCHGNSYYETRIGHKHKALGDRDFLGEFIQAARPAGITVVAYYLVCWDTLAATENPDWACVTSGGVRMDVATLGATWPWLCLNSPYRDYVYAQLEEVVGGYDIDAIMLDMNMFPAVADQGTCYCRYCRARFRREFGLELPTVVDWSSPLWKKYIEWRYSCQESFLREARDTVKSIKPDLAFTGNHLGWIYTSWRWGNRAVEPLKYFDYVMSEAYPEQMGYTSPSIFTRFIRGACDGKSFQTFSRRFQGKWWDFEVKPAAQMQWEMFTEVACGASVSIIDQLYHDGMVEPAVYDRVEQAYKEIEAREEWLLGAVPIPHAAIFWSQTTKDLYGQDTPEMTYASAMQGIDKALTECHYSCDFVFEKDLDHRKLAKYSVLILPNAVCLSDDQIAEITEYVKNGGGLVATYMTSLWDEKGEKRQDFGLSRIMNVSYQSPAGLSVGYYRPVQDHPVVLDIEDRPHLHSNGPLLLVESINDAQVVAKYVAPISERTPEGAGWAPTGEGIMKGGSEPDRRWFSNCPHMPPGRTTRYPAVVVGTHGQGKVVYMAMNIGTDYARYGYPADRVLIHNAVRWVSAAKPLVSVDGPLSMEATFFEQKDKGRIMVHLVNYHAQKTAGWKNDLGESIHGYVIVEESLPVNNVKVTVARKVHKAYLAPNNMQLEILHLENGESTVTIPWVKAWETLVLEVM